MGSRYSTNRRTLPRLLNHLLHLTHFRRIFIRLDHLHHHLSCFLCIFRVFDWVPIAYGYESLCYLLHNIRQPGSFDSSSLVIPPPTFCRLESNVCHPAWFCLLPLHVTLFWYDKLEATPLSTNHPPFKKPNLRNNTMYSHLDKNQKRDEKSFWLFKSKSTWTRTKLTKRRQASGTG